MIKIKVFEDTWKIILLSEEEFVRRLKSPGLSGLTDSVHKQVFINEEDCTLETTKHEMFHVFKYYTCTNSASLTETQMEEVFCDLFAVHGDKINKLAKHIYNELKDL